MSVNTGKICYDFRGAHLPPLVASRQGVWCRAITGAAPPTVQSVSGGPIELALTATNEAQNACLYMGDILPFDIDDLIRVTFIAKLSAALAADVMGAIGVASARNNTLDTVAEAAWFRFEGNNNLVCESDDGTTDNNDVATGETLVASYKRLVIDFQTGLKTIGPPSPSKGGKADVQFFAGNARGVLRRVAMGTSFDMSAYSGNLQLLAQIQKTAGTSVGTLSILGAEVEFKLPA